MMDSVQLSLKIKVLGSNVDPYALYDAEETFDSLFIWVGREMCHNAAFGNANIVWKLNQV